MADPQLLVELAGAAHAALGVLASSHSHGSGGSSGNGELLLLLSGPAAGVGLFWWVFRYYRNTDKSADFEHETAIAPLGPTSGSDTKIDEVRGTQDSSIRGDNSGDFRHRVQRIQ